MLGNLFLFAGRPTNLVKESNLVQLRPTVLAVGVVGVVWIFYCATYSSSYFHPVNLNGTAKERQKNTSSKRPLKVQQPAFSALCAGGRGGGGGGGSR